jgi:hypothetical protein
MATPSDAMMDAACAKFAEFGIDFRCPWQCDLDDAEQERFEALRAVLATLLASQEAEIAEMRKALAEAEPKFLRKHAKLVREVGPSGSPGGLASAMERRADTLEAAAALRPAETGDGQP